MGEWVQWADIELAVSQLIEDPLSATHLRNRLGQINDRDVARTLEDWFHRIALDRDADATDAARPSEKLLAPLQAVSMGAVVTAVVFATAGTVSLAAALFLGLGAVISATASSFGRWRLSKREDEALSDARMLRQFAKIAADARPKERS